MKLKPAAFLFDMDGTLTDARQHITEDVVDTLRSVTPGIKKHLVTGSDMCKIEEQIPQELLLGLFSRVYACNGTVVYNCDLVISSESGPAKGIDVANYIPHICYTHTPLTIIV